MKHLLKINRKIRLDKVNEISHGFNEQREEKIINRIILWFFGISLGYIVGHIIWFLIR